MAAQQAAPRGRRRNPRGQGERLRSELLMFGSELPPAKAFDMPDSPGRLAFMDSVQSIARAQQAGRVTAPGDPFRLASLVWAAVHGLVSLRMDRPNFPWTDLDAMIDETVRRLLLIS
jgi:hypothetical protein